MSHLRLLTRANIDAARWNTCLDTAVNNRVYAYAWYLDAVCGASWSALVWGDYVAIMPLPFNRKMGVRQVYPPFYTQQLGVFYSADFAMQHLPEFWAALPSYAYYANIRLNSHNNSSLPSNFALTAHPNHLLDLRAPYTTLYAGYNSGLQRRLRQAEKRGFVLDETVGYTEWSVMYAAHQAPKMGRLAPNLFALGASVMAAAVQAERGRWLGVRDSEGDLLCVLFLVRGNGRLIKLASATTPAGRQTAAYHWLVNWVIAQYAETVQYLDFEGSSIPGVAEFNTSFGATPETYYLLHYNYLPAPLRWFKP